MAATVAGGRAKQRRLGQALAGRPEVLSDGRPPAPRVVGDLLIALVKAGATVISPPVCAECGKALRTQQRRGDNWYCGVCGPVREPCTACGHLRPVNSRDRDGKPRCHRCPPGDGRDPVVLVTEVVASVDPSLPAGTVAAAVMSAVPGPGQRLPLAWALQDRPGLLTGDGAEAPVPAVLRLIDRLCDAGAQALALPPAPAAAGSGTCAGPSEGSGCAGTAWPGPGPGPAPGAAGPGNPRPATPAGRRCARTAWSMTRPISKSA